MAVPAVPALAPTPATTISAEDIIIPRLYVGNPLSKAVKHKRASYGDLYLAAGPDDPEAQVVYEAGSDAPGVLVHVLHLLKRKSWAPKGEQPISWDFDDPEAHEDAWITYNYTLFLPEIDPDMPVKLLLTKSGRTTARRINTVLGRGAGPLWGSAFRLTSAEQKSTDHEWMTVEAAQVTAEPAHVAQAGELFTLIAPGLNQPERRSTTDRETPEI